MRQALAPLPTHLTEVRLLVPQVEQELRALEERLLAAKSMVHALAAEVGQQEERLFQLLQKLGGRCSRPPARCCLYTSLRAC